MPTNYGVISRASEFHYTNLVSKPVIANKLTRIDGWYEKEIDTVHVVALTANEKRKLTFVARSAALLVGIKLIMDNGIKIQIFWS